MTDREQLGEPIESPRRDIAAVIGGLLGLHTDAVVQLLVADPVFGTVLSVLRDAVRARVAYRAFIRLCTKGRNDTIENLVDTLLEDELFVELMARGDYDPTTETAAELRERWLTVLRRAYR